MNGVVPLCLTFDTIGPLCRSIENAGLMLAAFEVTKPLPTGVGRILDVLLQVLKYDVLCDGTVHG